MVVAMCLDYIFTCRRMAMVRSGFQSHRARNGKTSASLLVDSGGLYAGQGGDDRHAQHV